MNLRQSGVCTLDRLNDAHQYGYPAIDLEPSHGTVVTGNKLQANNSAGIRVYGGYGDWRRIIISENAISNCEHGIYIDDKASRHLITKNTITSNRYGISLVSTNLIDVIGNKISYNVYGVYLDSGCKENNITGNIISVNVGAAVYLNTSSQENIVYVNNITQDNIGVEIGDDASRNTFYKNNFSENTLDVNNSKWNEYWHSTSPTAGNYWSNYSGTDNNHDGIGDTEYTITENNIDSYH